MNSLDQYSGLAFELKNSKEVVSSYVYFVGRLKTLNGVFSTPTLQAIIIVQWTTDFAYHFATFQLPIRQ